ncbi:hypothetical protein LPJ73_007826, partial [Coemansia sp. RSA 2703]
MKVPFFRSKNSSADGKGGKSKGRRGPPNALEGIASESDLSLAAATSHNAKATNGGSAIPPAAQAIADQVAEMEGFLTTIDGFQTEARRLFPENMALGQILDELRDECRRRVNYMSRVSAPPAWLAPAQQRPSSSSSTTISAMTGNYHTVGASAGTPGSTSSGGGRRGFLGKSSTTRGAPAQASISTVSGKTAGGAPRYASIESSPMSTATVTSSSSDSVSSHDRNTNGGGGNSGYFSRHQQTQGGNASVSTGRKPMLQLSNYASSSTGSPPSPSSPTMAARRDTRVADQRRKTAPQSMFVSSS